MVKRVQAAAVLILFFSVSCFSASTHSFLTIPVYARATGMAGAYTSLAEGTYGLYYNPAGIPSIMSFEAQLSWVPWLQGAQYGHISAVNPYLMFGCGKIGASFGWLSAERDAAGTKIYPVDWSAYPLSTVSLTNLHAVLGAGFDFLPQLSAGINMKASYEDTNNGTKLFNYGMDIGILAKFIMPGHVLKMGAVASNRGPELSASYIGFEPPAKVTAGISDEFEFFDSKLRIAADTAFSTDKTALFKIGFEYLLFDFVSIRAGYKVAAFNHPVFGLGFKYENAELHYAFEEYEDMGITHALSLVYSWGTPPAGIRAEPRLFSPNDDGIRDKTVIIPEINEISLVKSLKINIYGDDNSVKRVIVVDNKYAKSVEWDGKINGARAADGKYRLEIEAQYETNGTSRSRQLEVEIDTAPPLVYVTAAAGKNGPAKLPFVFSMSALDKNKIAEWEFIITGKTGEDFFTSRGAGTLPAVFEWAGTGTGNRQAEPGIKYAYSLKAVDSAGNRSETVAGALLIVKEKREIVLTFSSDALFEPGGTDVKTTAYQSLKKIKDAAKKYPGADIVIAGHTDSAEQTGKFSTRMELSEARAKAVKYYVINLLGITGREIATIGYGDTEPAAKGQGQTDRRVEVILKSREFK